MTTEPKLFTLAEAQDRFGDTFTAELRERGLIAEEPVDPLRVMADRFAVSQGCMDGGPFSNDVFSLLEQAKAIGMELAPRKELTREMVEEMTFPACDAAYREVYCDPVPEVRTPYVKAFARHFYAALTEALQ